jgi:hypothetical protein
VRNACTREERVRLLARAQTRQVGADATLGGVGVGVGAKRNKWA